MFTAEQKAFLDGTWRKPWLSIFCLPPFYINLTDKASLKGEITPWAVEIERVVDKHFVQI